MMNATLSQEQFSKADHVPVVAVHCNMGNDSSTKAVLLDSQEGLYKMKTKLRKSKPFSKRKNKLIFEIKRGHKEN